MKLSIATLPTIQVREHQIEKIVFSTGRLAEIQKNDEDPLLLTSWKEKRTIPETNLTPFVGELIKGDSTLRVWGFLDKSEKIVELYAQGNRLTCAKRQNFHIAVNHALSWFSHEDTRMYWLSDSSLFEATAGIKSTTVGIMEFIEGIRESLFAVDKTAFHEVEHVLLRRMAAMSYVNYERYVPLTYDFDLDKVDIEVEINTLLGLHINHEWDELDIELFQNDVFGLWINSLVEGKLDYEE